MNEARQYQEFAKRCRTEWKKISDSADARKWSIQLAVFAGAGPDAAAILALAEKLRTAAYDAEVELAAMEQKI